MVAELTGRAERPLSPEALRPPQSVGVIFLVVNRNNKILFVKDRNENKWGPPAETRKKGESDDTNEKSALLEFVSDRTATEVAPRLRKVFTQPGRFAYHYDPGMPVDCTVLFYDGPSDPMEPTDTSEIVEARWFGVDELLGRQDDPIGENPHRDFRPALGLPMHFFQTFLYQGMGEYFDRHAENPTYPLQELLDTLREQGGKSLREFHDAREQGEDVSKVHTPEFYELNGAQISAVIAHQDHSFWSNPDRVAQQRPQSRLREAISRRLLRFR